jgi:hypothetical protein
LEIFERVIPRAVGPDVQVEAMAEPFEKLMRLGKEVAGVDKDDTDIRLDAGCHVDEQGGFSAEAGGHNELIGELLRGPGDDALWMVSFEYSVACVDVDKLIKRGGHSVFPISYFPIGER